MNTALTCRLIQHEAAQLNLHGWQGPREANSPRAPWPYPAWSFQSFQCMMPCRQLHSVTLRHTATSAWRTPWFTSHWTRRTLGIPRQSSRAGPKQPQMPSTRPATARPAQDRPIVLLSDFTCSKQAPPCCGWGGSEGAWGRGGQRAGSPRDGGGKPEGGKREGEGRCQASGSPHVRGLGDRGDPETTHTAAKDGVASSAQGPSGKAARLVSTDQATSAPTNAPSERRLRHLPESRAPPFRVTFFSLGCRRNSDEPRICR